MDNNAITLKRHLFDQMVSWKDKRKRKPLILQGARQVGKTWLLKRFGSTCFDNYIVVNIDKDDAIRNLFRQTKDPHRLIEQIGMVKGLPILPNRTLLIFDEIQDSDEVLNSLKYFKEDAPEYAVACAGSLLGVAMRKKNRSFPVGMVDFMDLYPLSFSEFLDSYDERLAGIVRKWECGEQLPEIIHQELCEKLRIHLIVGGMPEAVVDWIESRDINEVDATLDNILRAYPLDFSKYATPAEMIRIQQVWDSMKRQLAKDNKKFKYSDIQKGARAREYETAVDWLCRAGLVHKVHNTETVRFPLEAYKDESIFKLYLNDVGLLRRMFHLDSATILQENRLFTEFKGIMTENYALLSLLRQEHTPLYWSSGNQAEIEFILEYKNRIIPVEVKSKESIQAKSLSIFRQRHDPEFSVRMSLRNLQLRDGLLNLPLYLADRMTDFIEHQPCLR